MDELPDDIEVLKRAPSVGGAGEHRMVGSRAAPFNMLVIRAKAAIARVTRPHAPVL